MSVSQAYWYSYSLTPHFPCRTLLTAPPLPGFPVKTCQFATLPSKHDNVNATAVMLNLREQRSAVAAAVIASQFAAVNNHHPTSSSPLCDHCRRSRHCINPRRCSPSRQSTSWVHRRGWSCQLPPIQSLSRLRLALTIGFLHITFTHVDLYP
jgi:hypothetical protein